MKFVRQHRSRISSSIYQSSRGLDGKIQGTESSLWDEFVHRTLERNRKEPYRRMNVCSSFTQLFSRKDAKNDREPRNWYGVSSSPSIRLAKTMNAREDARRVEHGWCPFVPRPFRSRRAPHSSASQYRWEISGPGAGRFFLFWGNKRRSRDTMKRARREFVASNNQLEYRDACNVLIERAVHTYTHIHTDASCSVSSRRASFPFAGCPPAPPPLTRARSPRLVNWRGDRAAITAACVVELISHG